MDACKRRIRHERSPLAKPQSTDQQPTMATAQARACTILVEFERARTELVGEAVILTNGKAGIVDRLWLDEFHGLRISIRSQEGNWPVSTIKICGAVGSFGRDAQQSCGGASKTANGMVRPCSRPASNECWQGAPKTRSTPCHRNSTLRPP